MLGYHISIYKLQSGAQPAPSAKAPRTDRLAVWQTGIGGLDWIDDLVKKGAAVSLGAFGYPTTYTAKIQDVRPRILDGPPDANEVWGYDPGDILTDKWCGKTTIDRGALDACSPNEWILVEAWDES
jgi:hypothetical protein